MLRVKACGELCQPQALTVLALMVAPQLHSYTAACELVASSVSRRRSLCWLLWRQPEPEVLKPKLEAFLKQHGVEYHYNTTTKFANFINKTLI